MIALHLAAKEEAFQESIKLKNQFRNLDEDEVEFLDSVLESTRAKEQAVKRETSEQLEIFRRQQEEAEKAALDGDITNTTAVSPTDSSLEPQWALNARKRKRLKEDKGLKRVKIRRSSTTTDTTPATPDHATTTDRDASTISTKIKDTAKTGGTNKAENSLPSPSEKATNKAVLPLPPKVSAPAKAGIGAGLGLADYSSDDD